MALFTTARVFALATLLRIVLLLYGLLQDAYSPLRYTDIDYFVFTDAATAVARGESPYARETYRYTPLLAWLLLPTTWGGAFWFAWGKIIFSLADLGAGWILVRLLQKPSAQWHATTTAASSEASLKPQASSGRAVSTGLTHEQVLKYASLWLLNPMVATISTRGSSEGLLGFLVLVVVQAALRRDALMTGLLLGLAVHAKIYPFIYGPALVLFFAQPDRSLEMLSWTDPRKIRGWLRALLNRDVILLVFAALSSFVTLNTWMYTIYGHDFLQHTFLHHLTRSDHRHNFSPYNTILYLSSSSSGLDSGASPSSTNVQSLWIGQWAAKIPHLAFVPQLLLSAVLIPLVLARQHLGSCLLAQTWAFVALNKVCTSQYFLWYLCLLPLHLPHSALGLGWSSPGQRSDHITVSKDIVMTQADAGSKNRSVAQDNADKSADTAVTSQEASPDPLPRHPDSPQSTQLLAIACWLAWTGAQGLWLTQAFRLEFEGRSTFVGRSRLDTHTSSQGPGQNNAIRVKSSTGIFKPPAQSAVDTAGMLAGGGGLWVATLLFAAVHLFMLGVIIDDVRRLVTSRTLVKWSRSS